MMVDGGFISASFVLCFSVCLCVEVLPVILMMCNERSQLDANSHVKASRQEVSGRRLTSLQ